jgi:hypothetical protein
MRESESEREEAALSEEVIALRLYMGVCARVCVCFVCVCVGVCACVSAYIYAGYICRADAEGVQRERLCS